MSAIITDAGPPSPPTAPEEPAIRVLPIGTSGSRPTPAGRRTCRRRPTEHPRRPVPATVTTRIELPTRTILKVVLAVTAIWLVVRLWNEVLLFFVAVLFAAAAEPAVERLKRQGWSRGRAVGTLLAASVTAAGLLAVVVVPPLIQQGGRLADNLPGYVDDAKGLLAGYPSVQNWLKDHANQESAPDGMFKGALSVGTGIFSGISNLFVLAALTVYLMLDGERLFAWLTDGLSASRRARAKRVRREVSRVVGGYLRGQLITSVLFSVFAFVTLSIAGVPEPLLFAVLAGVFDALPLVGATLATIPPVLMALTISVPTAVVVLVLFVAYQQVENYIIGPWAYKNTLQISSLAVLVAVTIGSALLGIVGALLALPIAAAIPAIVRTWNEDAPALPEPAVPWPAEPEPTANGTG
jgi:predicted PurR-regulated permease PerM